MTTVSQFRLKYVIPFERLQELNPSHPLTDEEAIIWAEECMLSEEVEEVGQNWLGEMVVEASIVDENGATAIYARENANLVKEDNMSKEQILKSIDTKIKPKIEKKDIVL